MAKIKTAPEFDIVLIGQKGRVGYEAGLFVASLRQSDPDFAGRVIILEPQEGGAWAEDPRMPEDLRELFTGTLDAEIRPFDAKHFGAHYPVGNKIEGLQALDADRPFVFFDSDTLVTGKISKIAFDFDRPAASMRRIGTWPQLEIYGPGYNEIWGSLYRKAGLDFEGSLDVSQPDEYWERYLYFNAGWFFGRSGPEFGELFLKHALMIRDNPTEESLLQELNPWLDQAALPLTIHALGGGRPGPELAGLDGDITTHYRTFPLLYARESDAAVAAAEAAMSSNKVKKVLKQHEPILRFVLQNKGQKARKMFDQANLPRKEQAIRNRLKSANLWMR
ncbi:hypothetical protein [Palleronia caenipelagi]|uniref:Uncharacterized protein n=1 Tax=Palleronia caenipelagi TaxID=2489174 RepID=A0A547PR95_9RHOB|nr:hypothetical protein [Palleronia caenipelagi]TRD16666.1 hypothetical protein FEV53_13765 [Palleronia caenipelagi]